MKKLFVIGVYRLYSFFVSKRIGIFFKEVKASRNGVISSEAIDHYLAAHHFETSIEDSSLMVKKDISSRLSQVNPDKIHSFAYTGGSYGEPFKLPYSKERAAVRTASFQYYNEIAGYRLGDPFLMIAAKERSRVLQFFRNEYRFVPKKLTEERIAGVADLLVRKKIKVIIGFSSVVYELARYIHKQGTPHYVEAIIFTSEPVTRAKSLFIQETFNCKVTDRYSNEEVGLIAQQEGEEGIYFTNRYNVLVEILNDDLQPVKEGESGKVVVTDLKADLLPIVRYDTGDLAVAHQYQNGRLTAIREVSGRTSEQIFTVEGAVIAPLALGPLIHKPLSDSGHYNQFQFVQTGPGKYELRIRTEEGLPGAILEIIKHNLLGVLGISAELSFIFLSDIPPQPSGKRPIYKNEWLNNKITQNV